ncbi:MAG: hypothetical protein NT141_01185, partial [candidate division WWE3 bacterium]|nr:hypothetical protein [candidate division WWE3 bacterium]
MKKLNLPEIIAGLIVIAMVVLTIASLPSLPSLVPFFYTLPWGELQLANKYLLFTLPALGLILLVFNLFFRTWASETKFLSLGICVLLLASEVKIISSVTSFWPTAFIDFKNIFLPLAIAGICSWLLSYPVIALAKRFGFVDDPKTHQHPAMLLKKPTPRAGGLAFSGAFLLAMLVIVPIDQIPWGIVFGLLLYTGLGLIDDKKDINPYVRFGILALGAAVVAVSGIGLKFFATPFGIVHLDSLRLNLPQFLGGSTFI